MVKFSIHRTLLFPKQQNFFQIHNQRREFQLQISEFRRARRLSTVTTNNELLVTYVYNANGMVIGRIYGNGTRTDYTLNAAGLVTTVTNRRGTTVLSSFAYTYYLDGNIQSVTETMAGETRVITYTYDLTRRLTVEQEVSTRYGLTIREYTFDNHGNRITMSEFGTESNTIFYRYDSSTRLRIKTPIIGEPTVYTYDANGNQLTRTTGNHVETRTYNAFNQLTSVTATGMTAVYNYRADGLRLSKTINGVTTTHLWNGANIVLEFNANRAAINRFYRSRSGRLLRGHQHGWYLHNVRGDVVQRTNAAGNILHNYRYSAFGIERDNSAQNTNPFRFAGEYWDWEREEYYLRARSFNPRIGRFTQPDPHWTIHNKQFGDTPTRRLHRTDALGRESSTIMPNSWAIMQSGNLFVYALNNPLSFSDPTGLFVLPALPKLAPKIFRGLQFAADIFTVTVATGIYFLFPPPGTSGVQSSGHSSASANGQSSSATTQSTAMTQGQVQGLLGSIAGGFENHQCGDAALAMAAALTNRQVFGWAELQFETINGERHVFAPTGRFLGTSISLNGYHVGITVQGQIFCNVFPYGLPTEVWFNSFHADDARRVEHLGTRYLGRYNLRGFLALTPHHTTRIFS